MLNKCYLLERNHLSNLRFVLDYDFPSHICCEFFRKTLFLEKLLLHNWIQQLLFWGSYFFRAAAFF